MAGLDSIWINLAGIPDFQLGDYVKFSFNKSISMIYLKLIPNSCRTGNPRTFLHHKPAMFQNKQASNHTNSYCPLPRRLLIMLYDGVILFGLLIVASAIALPIGNTQKVAFQDFWFTLWLLLVCFAYLGGCWRYGGMTVGMRAWKVKLIREDGGMISWPACLLRFMTATISAAVFGLGFLWALVDRKKRSWHDLAAGTLLIKSEITPQQTLN
ncbi:MAG: hypothetical protein GQ538_01010 [Xanthomonadales bacterium]|nr:hypothetical protein [Xanthomonadales bacterium]